MRSVRVLCPCCGAKLDVEIELNPVVQAAAPADGKTNMSFCDEVKELEFAGKTYCFTGKFECASRDQLQDLVERLGAASTDIMTNEVNYLVVGSRASKGWSCGNYGNKINDAIYKKQNGSALKLVSEYDFLEIIAAMGEKKAAEDK